MKFRTGTKVRWKTDGGYANGEVVETFDQTVVKTIQGMEYSKDGSPGNLALLIQQDTEEQALKLENEVELLDQLLGNI